MKKQKLIIESPFSSNTQKLTKNIINSKTKKNFELFYRQRDQTVQENPVQSIIFVKSKVCKPNQTTKKYKVQQQFKKIMNDLNAHLSQQKYQKSNKTLPKGFKNIENTHSQLKGTLSSKNYTKQAEFINKKNKITERQNSKTLKSPNKINISSPKENFLNKESFKSPTKNKKQTTFKKQRNLASPKTYKHQTDQKQNYLLQEKEIQRQKSPNCVKSTKKNLKDKSLQIKSKHNKPKQVLCSFQNYQQFLKVSNPQKKHGSNQTKRNIQRISLKNQEYIFIQDAFQLVPNKQIKRLETKLISTYRNNNKQSVYNNNIKDFQNKLRLKENEQIFQYVLDNKLRGDYQDYNINQTLNRVQKQSTKKNSLRQKHFQGQDASQQQLQNYSNQNQKIQSFLFSLQLKIKITIIQNWWRRQITKKKRKQQLKKLFTQNQKSKKIPSNKQKNEQNIYRNQYSNNEIVLQYPSVQSLQFNDDNLDNIQKQANNKKVYLKQANAVFISQKKQQQKSQVEMISQQTQIIHQKKQMHEKIILNLFKQNKISEKDYQNKKLQIEKEYQNQIQDLKKLYDLVFNKNELNDLAKSPQVKCVKQKKVTQKNKNQIDFIKDAKSSFQLDKNNQNQAQQSGTHEIQQQSQNQEIPLKIYKIGDKITSNMQQFIKQRKNNKIDQIKLSPSKKSLKMVTLQKYNKVTNELGQQYFQEFQQNSSNQSSPHKSFEFHVIQQASQDSYKFQTHAIQSNQNFIQLLEQFKQQQQIKSMIQKRIATQMGAFKEQILQRLCVDTNILAIHNFLVNFFKFYLYYYKEQFLRFINMPYGYQPEKRLRFMQGYDDSNDELSQDSDGIIYGLQYIISQDVFDEFVRQFYGQTQQNLSNEQRNIVSLSKIHDKLLFDCFNDALNNFRPYFLINGPPYAWNCSQKALTFYFITQQNIQQVFEKTQYKVLKWASVLNGLTIQKEICSIQAQTQPKKATQTFTLQQIAQNYQSNIHPVVSLCRQQRFTKQYKNELNQSLSYWNNLQQQKTSILYQLSSLILQDLASQMMRESLIY